MEKLALPSIGSRPDEFLAPISPITIFEEWFGAPSPIRTESGKGVKVDLLGSEEEFVSPMEYGRLLKEGKIRR